MTEFKVRYIGDDKAEIRAGDVCVAHDLRDDKRLYGVKDRSGEYYAYPKSLFEKVETNE